MSRLTIDEVAKLAFSSRSVVSRVLNNHPNVSAETRERVMSVIRKYNYQPNSSARSLVTDRAHEICILAPRREHALVSWIWPLLHLGISERSSSRGYFSSLAMISLDAAREVRDRLLFGRKFDGYLMIAEEAKSATLSELRKHRVPVVLIGSNEQAPDVSSIDVDNGAGAYQATHHLVSLGHTAIAGVFGKEGLPETRDRKRGYCRALQEAGLEINSLLLAEGDYSQRSGYELTRRWMEASVPISAIFYASDSMAIGGIRALYEAGRSVPDDVAVVGFDDLPNSQYSTPPLTTIHQPIYEKGARAAEMLIDLIEGRNTAACHVRLAPRLVVRRTCGSPAWPENRSIGSVS